MGGDRQGDDQQPDVLLTDEPVPNLEPKLAAGVIDDIVHLVRDNGLTAVLNLHDVALARRVADRIIGMRAGQVVFDRPSNQLPYRSGAGRHLRPRRRRTTGGGPTTGSDTERLASYRRPSRATLAATASVAVVLEVSWNGSELSLPALAEEIPNIADFVGRMFPPDPAELGKALELRGQTLAIAAVGTAIGVVFAVPWGLLAARTLFGQNWLHHSVRASVNLVGAVPELMWVLLFVSAIGLGPLAGTMALAIGSATGLASLFADIFEASDRRAWQTAGASGADKAQLISWVLLPQSLPTLTSYTTLLVLDGNVRATSLLGLVGAGGIGLELNQKLRLFDYGSVLTLLLVVLAVVVILDRISSYL